MPFELPKLNYEYTDLEPYIDTMTMEIHHSKHHAAYVNNLNKALEMHPELQSKTIEELLTSLASLPEAIKNAVRNNGGGHYNHSLFWTLLTPKSEYLETSQIANEINNTYGNLENFKMEFGKAAMSRFGSGWAWLLLDKNKNLTIVSTPNQDSPVAEGLVPLLALDVWEHAYYLMHQNRRADYINSFWNVVNWDQVEANYKKGLESF